MRKVKEKPAYTRGLIRKFFSYYGPHRGLFALDLVCSFLVASCNLFYPFVTQQIVGNFVPNRELMLILVWLGVLLAIFAVKAILSYIVQFWGHVLGVRIQGDMRRELFRHIQRMPFSYFDETKTGSIMSRLTNDLFEVSELAHHGPEDFFLSLISIFGALVMLVITVDPYLALVVAGVLPLMLLFAVFARRRMNEAFRKSREKMAEINADIESSISGIRVSKAYTAERIEEEKFERSNSAFCTARASAYKSMGFFFSGMGFFNDFLYFAALLAGGLFFYYGRIDLPEFTAYLLYVTMLLNPIRTLVNVFEQIQDGMTGFTRFREVMSLPAEPDPAEPVAVGRLVGAIEFDNVSFAYDGDDGRRVIDHLSLTLPAGKTVALVGPSGGGKTTLCHLIPRFYDVDEGSIKIDGIDIARMRREDLRRNVGMVAQDVFLYGGTVRDNIAYGDPEATDERIVAAAKLANIHDFVAALPDGYDTEVGERGVKLSGGQKQRISIARAFLKNPPILILDEATSALDNVTELMIQHSLEELSKGRTTIVVAHRLSTVKNADEIIVFTADGVAERGTHAALMAMHGIYAELYETQFRVLD